MKKFISALTFACLLTSLLIITGCQRKSNDNNNLVILGTIAGPETTLAEVAKKVAKEKYNLTINIKAFTDYIEPNRALQEGVIDANMFQHYAYLQNAEKNFGYKFAVIGKTFIYPMGLYSKKIKSLAELPEHGIVVIPNDPSNEARALLLLQQAGLIKLKDPTDINSTAADITENPKQLVIKEMDAAMIPRVLADASLAAINTNYAKNANLSPSKDALFIEDKDSPYVNLVVVQEKNKAQEKFKRLMLAINSPEVAKEADVLFDHEAIKAW